MLQALVPRMTRTEAGTRTLTELRHEDEEGQITLMLGSFPDAVAKAFHISAASCEELSAAEDDAAAAAALQKKHLPTGDDWKTVVLIPIRMDDPGAIKAYQRCCPTAAIIGGLAGDQLLLHALGKTEIIESGVVGLAMKGDVPLTALVSRGCQPLSLPMLARGATVRGGDDNEKELLIPEFATGEGGTIKPIEVVIKAQEQMDRRFPMFAGVRHRPDTGYVLESISQSMFERGGAMRVPWEGEAAGPAEAAQAPAHCEVRVFQLSPAACKADLQQLLSYVRAQCEERDEQVLGSVMFTCGARTQRFFREDCADAKRFQEAFPSVPLVGFWARGEIGPQALAEAAPSEATRTGRAQLQGFTAVFGIFRAPKASRRTLLAVLADEQVPAEVGTALAHLAHEAKERGNTAFRNADAENAVAQYTRAVDLAAVPSAVVDPCERATILSNRAAAHLKGGNAEAALQDAEAAAGLDPSNVKAHHRKAQALLELKRSQEAVAVLRPAVERFPEEKALADLLEKAEKGSA